MGRGATEEKDAPVAYPVSKRWKVPDIVPRDNGCVYHALSLMRLALGYKTGLPEGITELGAIPICDIPDLAKLCFPDRHIMAIISNAQGCFFGDWWCHYIMAFCYRDKDSEESHMVVGDPVTNKEQEVDLILAVSIDRKWES